MMDVWLAKVQGALSRIFALKAMDFRHFFVIFERIGDRILPRLTIPLPRSAKGVGLPGQNDAHREDSVGRYSYCLCLRNIVLFQINLAIKPTSKSGFELEYTDAFSRYAVGLRHGNVADC
jgi:hypothetical protein